MRLTEYPDRDLLFVDLASRLASDLEDALLSNDRVTLAVPGGSTPGPMFDQLSAADLDWSRVDVMLTDERRVPADHERSNERLLRERLLVNRASAATFLRTVPDENKTMDRLNAALAARLPINVLVLGMGSDMHTASLFPGSPDLPGALAADAAPLMMVDASEGLEPRITLTGPVLASAISTHLLIAGSDKLTALNRAAELPPIDAPVSLVLKDAEIHWAP